MLAEKLGIAPQSISKWECGIGYPDVTLFPQIAELFGVEIGVLFGKSKEDDANMIHGNEKKFAFKPLHRVEFLVANECEIRVFRNEAEKACLEITGDASFIDYLGIENNDGILQINVKNPTGSDTEWIPYDRGDYNKRNTITLHTGKELCDIGVVNYINLNCYENEIDKNTDQWIFMKE